jgi:uncharacterized membrane protein
MSEKYFDQLLSREDEQLQKLNQIVHAAIEEEKVLSGKLLEVDDIHPPLAGRVADKLAGFGGSWKFIGVFVLFILLWIILNVTYLQYSFDPYPFILLNLLLSTIAALQAPLIMMSQNRKEEKDRKRAVNDYMVNLKAEIEVRNLHEKIDLLITEQMQTLFKIQQTQVQLMEEIKSMIHPQRTDQAGAA